MSLVCLNGVLVPAADARVSLFDRGFLYGDGLFETVRLQGGRLFRWNAHLERLDHGCRVLGLHLPHDHAALTRHATELITAARATDAVLRLTISRGPGVRGYSPAGADSPTVALSLHPLPPTSTSAPGSGADSDCSGARLITARQRVLAGDPLNGVKSSSKLACVLARAEADAAGVEDALLCNHLGEMAETAGWNLFWVTSGQLLTPPAAAGALPGIARGAVLELAPSFGLTPLERTGPPTLLAQADAVFTTNVVSGLREIIALDGQPLRRDSRFAGWKSAFEALVRSETT